MKFWNKLYGEMTVRELTIWAVALSVIAGAISYISVAMGQFETVTEKISGIGNKIFHK